jgi:UDP-N-acetylglucosamine 1-carboxyvinyltransferase
MISLLKSLGCKAVFSADGVSINTDNVHCGSMPADAVTGMRSSLFLLGALLGRCGEAVMDYPGGCVIGERPINLHIESLEKMGVHFEEKDNRLYAHTDGLKGADIKLSIPSVGATENIIMSAAAAKGTTRIMNAAREPEIETLCRYLGKCGADIEGAGTECIIIHGGNRLKSADYIIPADRIVAGTYLFACVAAGGNVLLTDTPCQQMKSVFDVAENMGTHIDISDKGIYVQSPARPVLSGRIDTAPYPGFPTDLQSAALAAAACGEGRLTIQENIFENRFRIVDALKSMGAEIDVLDKTKVSVRGVDKLEGRVVKASELRGGAALVIAGLKARGETVIKGCSYIYRGYENICRDLRELGVRITSVQ